MGYSNLLNLSNIQVIADIGSVYFSYNDSILAYNNKCKTFPGNMFAGMFGFKEKEYLNITEAEKKPVKVSF